MTENRSAAFDCRHRRRWYDHGRLIEAPVLLLDVHGTMVIYTRHAVLLLVIAWLGGSGRAHTDDQVAGTERQRSLVTVWLIAADHNDATLCRRRVQILWSLVRSAAVVSNRGIWFNLFSVAGDCMTGKTGSLRSDALSTRRSLTSHSQLLS